MDISTRFSLEDFLAYFFPGVTGALGIYALLRFTPWNQSIPPLTLDLTTGIILFILSYVIGVLLSGLSELLFSKLKGYKETIPFGEDLKKVVVSIFRETFRIPKDSKVEWSREHYYLCRSLVFEQMPWTLSVVQRQSGLRQLRISLVPVLLIWLLVGIAWGAESIRDQAVMDGALKILVSVMVFLPLLFLTINRARNNEYREVREVLTAFIAGNRANSVIRKEKPEPFLQKN